MWEVLNKLVQNQSLALVLAGLLLLVVAATGHLPWPGGQISSGPWQVVLGLAGVATAGLGARAMWAPRQAEERFQWHCTITSPRDNDLVEPKVSVRGDCESKLPAGYVLQIFDVNTRDTYYRPRRVGVISDDERHWQANDVTLGGRPGDIRVIAVAVMGMAGQALCDYYHLREQGGGNPPGIRKLTPDINIRSQVSVRLNPGAKP